MTDAASPQVVPNALTPTPATTQGAISTEETSQRLERLEAAILQFVTKDDLVKEIAQFEAKLDAKLDARLSELKAFLGQLVQAKAPAVRAPPAIFRDFEQLAACLTDEGKRQLNPDGAIHHGQLIVDTYVSFRI
jgi:hypothetical protein